MTDLRRTLAPLELAQLCWVIPDIEVTADFLGAMLGGVTFPPPQRVRAQDLGMTYHGELADADWLTTQAFDGRLSIELVQPLAGPSMFRDYLRDHPTGGMQHAAFRLPIEASDRVTSALLGQGYALISEVDHPIARMSFFDTYRTLGMATEIMGVTPAGWAAIDQMRAGR